MVKLIKKLDINDLAGEKVIIDYDTENYYVLQGIASEIWDMLSMEQALEIQDIVARLLQEYEVEEADCKNQVMTFLNQLKDLEYVEILSLQK